MNRVKAVLNNSLYLNSTFLILSTGILAVSGFLYWWIAARVSNSYNLGVASTLTSVMNYIALISQLGFNVSLIAYLPKSESPAKKISTAFTTVILLAGFFSLLFVLLSGNFLDSLSFILQYPFLALTFIYFVIFAALNVTIESVFIATRQSRNVLIKNTILSLLKFILLLMLVSWAGYGIFVAWAAAIFVSVVSSYHLLPVELRRELKLRIFKIELKEMVNYSVGNYLGSLASNLSLYAIPVIITAMSGPIMTAYYSVAMSFALLLFSIPVAICNSLFAEGAANEENFFHATARAIKLISLIIIPAIICLVAFGKHALLLFGVEYSEQAAPLLSLLSLSGIFVSFNTVCWTLLNIKHRIREIVFVLSTSSLIILFLIFLFAKNGLTGVGSAWLIGQVITSILYLPPLIRLYRFSFVMDDHRS